MNIHLFNPDGTFKNELIKSYVDKIEVNKDEIIWYLKFSSNSKGEKLYFSDFKNKLGSLVSCNTGCN